jgi:hypothetical protein
MRVIILLIIIVAAIVIFQHERNHCVWGSQGWAHCILTWNGSSVDVSP